MHIKLLALETHQRKLKSGKWSTSGVDWARIIQPATHLSKLPDFHIEIRKEPFTTDEPDWNAITKKWDVIFTSYIDEPLGYVQMAFWAEKNNCTIVADLDDNVWQLDKANPVYEAYHPGSEKLHILSSIFEHVKHVTVSTQPLQRVLHKLCGRSYESTKVLPNYIDLEQYDYSKRIEKKSDKITILHAGSSTHHKDLTESEFMRGLERVLGEHPECQFVTIGNWIPELTTKLGGQYRQLQGKPDVYEWINELYPEVIGMTDIVVVPLKYDDHTRCKSSIKFLEFSAGKVPGVYQKMRQYEEHLSFTNRGFLASRADEWYTHLKKLVTDEKLRKETGENAYQYVKDTQTIQGNINLHAEYFRGISSPCTS